MKTEKKMRRATDRRGQIIVGLLVAGMVIGLIALANSVDGWGLTATLRRNPLTRIFGAPDYHERAEHPIVSLPDVVVGLGGAGELYVDAAFDLEVASEQDREAVRRQMPRVREETIGFLSELSPDELRGSGGLSKTKARLLDRFRTVMPKQRLKAIYVTYLAVAKP